MSADEDRALLRRFEPIICFTRGERFFPIDVEPYARVCSLWMQQHDQKPICLVPEGQLSLEKLTELRTYGFGTIYYLKFIEPLNITELAVYRFREEFKKKDPRYVFHAGRGRLARVGYGSRFVAALFSLSLLARGRVPGDTAAAAALAYEKILADKDSHCYYGRVVRLNGWIALQYWFFYPFNNWRSGFFGVNDHEADWEMIYVYLFESKNGEVIPEWVAYASHDLSGDDLRRRWDDPELRKVGDHPVIFTGAGSHASYFAPGEYLTEVELPFLSPLVRLVDILQSVSRRVLGLNQRYTENGEKRPMFNVFRIPFVDYARGDGISIGPGGDMEWDEPRLLSPPPDWAVQYRGLWGLYARDSIAGENAPAGPVYNRDGAVRRSWYDPLGWCGLDKVPPPSKALEKTMERCREIESHRIALADIISEKSKELLDLGVEVEAMLGQPHLAKLREAHQKRITILSEDIKKLRAQYALDGSLLEALKEHTGRLRLGERGPAREHIRRANRPASDTSLRLSRIAESWAAISIGVTMLGFVGIVLFARQYLLIGLLSMISIVVFVEASFRRHLTHLVSSLTIGLAIVAVIILLFEFFWSIVVLAVILAGGYIMWENIRELRS